MAKYSKEKVIEQIDTISCSLFEIYNNYDKAQSLTSWQIRQIMKSESFLRAIVKDYSTGAGK